MANEAQRTYMFLGRARIYTYLQSHRNQFLRMVESERRWVGNDMRTFVIFTDIWLIIHDGDGTNGAIIAAHWTCAHRFGNLLALFNVGLV